MEKITGESNRLLEMAQNAPYGAVVLLREKVLEVPTPNHEVNDADYIKSARAYIKPKPREILVVAGIAENLGTVEYFAAVNPKSGRTFCFEDNKHYKEPNEASATTIESLINDTFKIHPADIKPPVIEVSPGLMDELNTTDVDIAPEAFIKALRDKIDKLTPTVQITSDSKEVGVEQPALAEDPKLNSEVEVAQAPTAQETVDSKEVAVAQSALAEDPKLNSEAKVASIQPVEISEGFPHDILNSDPVIHESGWVKDDDGGVRPVDQVIAVPTTEPALQAVVAETGAALLEELKIDLTLQEQKEVIYGVMGLYSQTTGIKEKNSVLFAAVSKVTRGVQIETGVSLTAESAAAYFKAEAKKLSDAGDLVSAEKYLIVAEAARQYLLQKSDGGVIDMLKGIKFVRQILAKRSEMVALSKLNTLMLNYNDNNRQVATKLLIDLQVKRMISRSPNMF